MTETTIDARAPGKLWVFMTVWLGQLVSYAGSGLTGFALSVWVYETTGSISKMTLIGAATVLPTVLLSPFAGAYVDRWDRRRALIFSDAGAGASTLAIAVLLVTGQLRIWHIYVAVCASSVFGAFRWPALTASITQLIPKSQFGRAGGLLQIVQAAQLLISPVLAGALMTRIRLQGVVLIDVATFVVALATLFAVSIPRPEPTAAGQSGKGSILRESIYGWTYISERAGLRALLIYGFGVNLCIDMASFLVIPFVLGKSSSAALGTTLSIGGTGFLVGGAIMSAWGGPRRAIYGVIGFPVLAGVFLTLIGLQSSMLGITVCLFAVLTCLPLLYACSQVIWQRVAAPDIQGRVFAIRRMVIMSSRLVGAVTVGLLADHLFTPLFGPGRGISVMFIVLGFVVLAMSAAASVYSPLRLIDSHSPDAVGEAVPRQARAAV